MFMAGTNWADGPAFVSQCPIAKGNSFLYDFTALDQAGTYWYHSHLCKFLNYIDINKYSPSSFSDSIL